MEFVYIIRTHEFERMNDDVYKIGRTSKPHKRFRNYPKGSRLKLLIPVTDSVLYEKNLIEIFRTKFKHRKDHGAEYFEGDLMTMVQIFKSFELIEGDSTESSELPVYVSSESF